MSFFIELFCVVTLQYQILVRIAIAYFIIEKKKAAPQPWQAIAQRFCSIGNYVKFIMNISKEQIDISTNLQDISNYVYLLNLKNRYANPQIYNYLLNLGNSLYSDIIQYENNLGKKLTDSELYNYITTAKKHDKKHIPLYFALMSIYNNYDNYILYLHNIKS